MTETETEITADSLQAALADFDSGNKEASAVTAVAKPDTKDEPAAKTAAAQPAADAKASKDKPAADTADKKSSTEAKATEPSNTEDKELSKRTQNEERKRLTWEKLNEERETTRKEREAFAKEKEDFLRNKAAADAYKDERGHTAKDYRQVAEQFRKEGKTAEADQADKIAGDYDRKESDAKFQAGKAKWDKNLAELTEKHPDLSDPQSEFSQELRKAMEGYPALRADPEGIKVYVRAAETAMQLKEFEGTKAKYKELQDKHDKLQKKLSISGGSPTEAPAGDKPFEALSDAEQKRALEQSMAAMDRERGFAN